MPRSLTKRSAGIRRYVSTNNMKRSSFFHWSARIAGIWGTLALIGAWGAGESGTFLGFSQQHLYNDAIVLTLISISALLCAQFYWHEERNM